MLLLALLVAAGLRFWQLDQAPPGLYRDEAFNGLDAVRVLEGEHALFFPANNGREPLYIYLTALAVSLLGQTTLAVRAAAALVGTLTTIPIYLLSRSWFGWRVAIFAAWLWAITLWPVHLSRLGLRTVLIAPIMAMTFWLATLAYRRQTTWLWIVAGLVYGLGFYSYLAYRFTPLLLLCIVGYLALTGQSRRLRPGLLWFALGAAICLAPLALLFGQDAGLLIGRSGQVSILNPDVADGSPLAALARNVWATAGMFIWRGDQILRHNPPGRPVFDPLIAIPFLLGVLWCLRKWRQPASAVLLLWLGVMLGPTILAEDAPHFLRAAGALPAAILVAGVGLESLRGWSRWPQAVGTILAAALLAGSLLWTVVDYGAYSRDPQVAYAFETAAAELAGEINQQVGERDVFLDERLWTSWPSLNFLVRDASVLNRFESGDDLPSAMSAPATLFAWPYDATDYLEDLFVPPGVVSPADGALTRGDLEETAYPLYVQYTFEPSSSAYGEPLVIFGDQLSLQDVSVSETDPNVLQVVLYWEAATAHEDGLIAFVHVLGPEGIIGQYDQPVANGRWPAAWWRQELLVRDLYTIVLDTAYDADQHDVEVGLYRASDGERLPVRDGLDGRNLGMSWVLTGD